MKATWLGEEATPDLQETTRFGTVFKKGEAVEIADMYGSKLLHNPNFKVEGEPEPKHEEPLTYRPPSQQSAQGPVPKAGDPIVPEMPPAPPEVVEPPPEEPPPEGETAKAKPTTGTKPLRRV